MINNNKLHEIKSLLVLKKIFSQIYERRKLYLIIYNKTLQNKLKIGIINYKRFSTKYKEAEKDGQGKEFDIYTNELIFEGLYKNGKKNGKGREYDRINNIIFEGEYKNDKRNGIGKEFDNCKNIIFEGNYINGIRNGFGKDYIDKIIIYEGNFFNGEKYGLGKEYSNLKNNNGEYFYLFEGEYLRNHKVKGKLYINGKFEYEGEFLYDKKFEGRGYDDKGKVIYKLNNGEGKVKEYNYYGDLLYEGQIKNLLKNGKVKEYENNILIFSGSFLNGVKQGFCKEYNHKGELIFKGYYNNGIRHGYGFEFSQKNIKKFEGNFVEGQKIGKGREYYKNGRIKFEGEYDNDLKHGKGKEYYKNGKLKFEGEYKLNKIKQKRINIISYIINNKFKFCNIKKIYYIKNIKDKLK